MSFGREFADEIEEHTAEARGKFTMTGVHLERDMPDRTFWLSVMVEEVGKLSRACNKLAIAVDPNVRKQWEDEGLHRLLTIATTARRMAEQWRRIPDEGRS